jgi:hypothetical protein
VNITAAMQMLHLAGACFLKAGEAIDVEFAQSISEDRQLIS